MELKTLIIVTFLVVFAHHNECILLNPLFFGRILQTEWENHLLTRRSYYVCPKSPETIYPGASLSANQAGASSANNGKTEKSLEVIPPRVLRLAFPSIMGKRDPRAVKNLDMTVLPSNEVCLAGKKLKNIILPQNYRDQIMTGIAIWLSPCVSRAIHTKSNDCMEKRLKAMESIDVDAFRRLYFTVRAVMDR